MAERRSLTFPDATSKANYLDFMAGLERWSAPVQALVRAHGWGAMPAATRAASIHGHVRDRYVYMRDPSRVEELADAGTIVERGWDDCDGKVRLFVACCRASDIEARVRPVHEGGAFRHVQGEVRFPGSERAARAQPGGWLVAELILRGVPLGAGAEAAQRDRRGRVFYAG